MNKKKTACRETTFLSKKNGTIITVRSPEAKRVALLLENDVDVEGYETDVLLEGDLSEISPVGIRSSYMKIDWVSDFLVRKKTGETEVLEVVLPENLEKLAHIERLELSRRYWTSRGVNSWKIVLVERGHTAW